MTFTQGRGVDVVLDMVGGDYVQHNLNCLAADGRYALISLQGGANATINLEPVLRRRLTLVGSTLRPLSPEVKAAITERIVRDILPIVADGRLRSHIHATFSMEEVGEAHRALERSGHFGKLVLTMESARSEGEARVAT